MKRWHPSLLVAIGFLAGVTYPSFLSWAIIIGGLMLHWSLIGGANDKT